MSSDRDAFLRAICAAPDDDTPRLVFADWLDEHGDPTRAASVRDQCELEHAEEFGPRWRELKGRCDRLAAEHHDAWSAELTGRGVLNVEYRRGFVDGVTVYSKRFVAEHAELFARAPVRRVKFANLFAASGNVPLADLFACSALARLRGLDLSTSTLTDAAVAELAGSPHLRGLEDLTLNAGAVTEDAARALMRSPNLPGLTRLEVWGGYGDDFLPALAEEPGFRRITSLTVRGSVLGPPGITALVNSLHAAGLQVLRLSTSGESADTRAGPRGTQALAASPHLAGLTTLILTTQKVGLGGVKALAGPSLLRGLRHLNLSGNPFTESMVAALLKSESLKGLVSLGLRYCGLRPTDVTNLKAAFPNTVIDAEGW